MEVSVSFLIVFVLMWMVGPITQVLFLVAPKLHHKLGMTEDNALKPEFRWFLLDEKEWVSNPGRCRKAGIPEAERKQRSKSELALEMVRHQKALGLRLWPRLAVHEWLAQFTITATDPVLGQSARRRGQPTKQEVRARRG